MSPFVLFPQLAGLNDFLTKSRCGLRGAERTCARIRGEAAAQQQQAPLQMRPISLFAVGFSSSKPAARHRPDSEVDRRCPRACCYESATRTARNSGKLVATNSTRS